MSFVELRLHGLEMALFDWHAGSQAEHTGLCGKGAPSLVTHGHYLAILTGTTLTDLVHTFIFGKHQLLKVRLATGKETP